MDSIEIRLLAERLAKRYGKIKKIQEQLKDFPENPNKVYIYKAIHRIGINGIGFRYPVAFSTHKRDPKLKTHRLTPASTVLCYVLNYTGEDVNTLNFDWHKAKKFQFDIRNANDYQKLKVWYNQQRKGGRIISPFVMI